MKQGTAELLLEQLDGPRQRRLRNIAPLRRSGEIQFLGDREEVADLMHFHATAPRSAELSGTSSAEERG